MLSEDKFADEIKDGILFQNILPHIGNAVFIFIYRISCTGIDAFSVANIEGQEEGD